MDDLFRMQAMKKTTIDFHYKSTNTNDRSSYRDEDSKKKLCRELIILETVKMNTKDIVVYETYEGRIPILFHCFAKVGFLRMKDIPPGL